MIKFLLKLMGQAEPIAEAWRQVLASEEVLQSVQDIPTTITYRNYSRPGKWCGWNRQAGLATAIAVTRKRFVVFKCGRKLLNMPFDSEFWDAVSVTQRDDSTLRVVVNATAFPNKHKGEIEFWFHTPRAPTLLSAISGQLEAPR